jgi:hypothetical protein
MSLNEIKKSWSRRIVFLAATAMLGALVALPQPVLAAEEEEEKTTYTRVQLWEVERARWDDFVDMFEQNDVPILEKLKADGAISEWGIDAAVLHHPKGYTHSTWYSAGSLGALTKAGEAYIAAWEAKDKDSMKALDADFASMIVKHRDYLIDTDGMRSVGGTFDSGYYYAAFVQVARGKHRAYHSYWDNRVKPVYEKLFDEGVVLAFGLTTETITTDNPRGHWSWYIVGDADGLDAVNAAFDASWGEEDEEGRRARWTSILDVVEPDTFHETMTSIIKMSLTAQ